MLLLFPFLLLLSFQCTAQKKREIFPFCWVLRVWWSSEAMTDSRVQLGEMLLLPGERRGGSGGGLIVVFSGAVVKKKCRANKTTPRHLNFSTKESAQQHYGGFNFVPVRAGCYSVSDRLEWAFFSCLPVTHLYFPVEVCFWKPRADCDFEELMIRKLLASSS